MISPRSLTWYTDLSNKSFDKRGGILKIIIALTILLVLMKVSAGATLKGSVYDINLEPLNDAIVSIDSQPPQQMIVKDGDYMFALPPGKYTVSGKYYEDNILKFKDNAEIEIIDDGEFVFDLILFPNLEEDIKLFDDIDEDFLYTGDDTNGKDYSWLIKWVIAVIVVCFAIFGYFWYKNRKKEVKTKAKDETEADEYYDKILNMIKEHKRITQKEIRKEIPLSEAKISLIITELEHKGKIEKIKKGRGNILVLK